MSGMFRAFNLKKTKNFVLSIILPVAVGILAGFFTKGSRDIYETLARPILSPPGWVFGVVWPILYVLMGIAAYLAGRPGPFGDEEKKPMWLYYVQLAVNFFWSIIFFNLQMFGFAFVWLLLLLLLVILTTVRFYDVSRAAGWLMVPYVAWICFAGYLNYMIWMLN